MMLNPGLDPDALSAELAAERRLQIRDILVPEAAERIHGLLARQTPWWLVYNSGDERVEQIAPEMLARLAPAQIEQLHAQIVERAQHHYQFVYASYPITGNYFSTDAKPPIAALFEYLNSPPVLDWFRRLTGRDDVQWIDAQATLYQAGHFLKSHSDRDDAGVRAAAYVLNFTKLWERDWGGYLQFYNDEHDIELALRPIFNALNIFLVPTDHSVGIVAPFAYGDRYSVTGWLRTDSPPGSFGRISL